MGDVLFEERRGQCLGRAEQSPREELLPKRGLVDENVSCHLHYFAFQLLLGTSSVSGILLARRNVRTGRSSQSPSLQRAVSPSSYFISMYVIYCCLSLPWKLTLLTLLPGEGFPTVLEEPREPGKCLAQSGLMGLGPGQLVAQLWAQKALHLVSCSAVALLRFLIILEPWILHFCFSLDSLNYVASPPPGEPSYFHLCSFSSSCFDVALGFALLWVDLSLLLWAWSKRKSKKQNKKPAMEQK